MKGIELPINTLIILVIALLILIAIIAFFLGVWGPGTSGVTLEATKTSACQRFISLDCLDADLISFNTIQCTGIDVSNLQELADNCYGGVSPLELCNCP